jgi:transcriptional regulator with XRE-family HTH domain
MDNETPNPDIEESEAKHSPKFSELIYRVRKDRNLTKDELAALIGVAQLEVDDWEREKSVAHQDKLTKLAQRLNLAKSEIDSLRKAARQFENPIEKLSESSEPVLVVRDEKESLKPLESPGQSQPAEIPSGPPPPKIIYEQQTYVSENRLRALDDLREEQIKWQGVCNICIGAMLAVGVNLVTGAIFTTVTLVFLASCLIVALITWSAALQKKRQAEEVKKKLLGEKQTIES